MTDHGAGQGLHLWIKAVETDEGIMVRNAAGKEWELHNVPDEDCIDWLDLEDLAALGSADRDVAVEAARQEYAPLVVAARALIDDITSEFKDYDLDPLEQAIAAALKALEADRG